jgi:hypothetical protein
MPFLIGMIVGRLLSGPRSRRVIRALALLLAAAFCALAASFATTVPAAAFLLLLSLGAVLLFLRGVVRPAVPPGGAISPRPRPIARRGAPLLDQAQARTGQPIHALCPFELRAQDRPGERWQGSQHMWIALGDQTVWFLHDATLGRLGGVWDALPRQGLHSLTTESRDHHDVELSWPLMPRLLIGTLRGTATERRRLLGLLAADELGVRDLLDRPSRTP